MLSVWQLKLFPLDRILLQSMSVPLKEVSHHFIYYELVTIYILKPIVPVVAPDNVSILAINATTIYLSWNGVISLVGIIRDYIIRVSEVNTGLIKNYRTSLTSIAISVHPDYVYSCSVSAFTVAAGPFSNIVTVKTPQDGK